MKSENIQTPRECYLVSLPEAHEGVGAEGTEADF
jgi:hypothetical protein